MGRGAERLPADPAGRRLMQAPDIFVYLIATKSDSGPVAPIKVGVSGTPEARLETLQTASPYELELVAKLTFPSREWAMQFEGCFHYTQREHRLRGEWFDIPPWRALAILRTHARWVVSIIDGASAEDQKAALSYIEWHLDEAVHG